MLADRRIKASPKQLYDALHGRLTDHHRFMLQLYLDQCDAVEASIVKIDQQIDTALTGETFAISRTYLHDISNNPDPRADPLVWYGVYDEDYSKIEGAWQTQRCELQFHWPQPLGAGDFPSKMTPRAQG